MGWVGDLCRRFFLTCLHWWMMLTYEMVCKDEASFGVTAETVEKRQHVQFPPWIPTLFSSALLPLGLENNSLHPRQKYRGRKEISRHKSSLCNAVKLHWFIYLFFCIFDRQHKIVASCHVTLGLGDHIGSASIAQFFGKNVSWTRHCGETLTVSIHLCEVPAFTQRHIIRRQKVNLKPELVLCPTLSPTLLNTLYSWPQSSVEYSIHSLGLLRQWDSGWMDSKTGSGKGRWFVSGFLWRIGSCVIRPKYDPTCPDVPPHPPSCTCLTHTLMNRWSRAASDLQSDLVRISHNCHRCMNYQGIQNIILLP